MKKNVAITITSIIILVIGLTTTITIVNYNNDMGQLQANRKKTIQAKELKVQKYKTKEELKLKAKMMNYNHLRLEQEYKEKQKDQEDKAKAEDKTIKDDKEVQVARETHEKQTNAVKTKTDEIQNAANINGLSAYSTREYGSDNSFTYDVSSYLQGGNIIVSWYKPSAGYGYVSKGQVSGNVNITIDKNGIVKNINATNTSIPDVETGCEWDLGTWRGFDPVLNIHIGDSIIGSKSWLTVSDGRVNSGSTIGSAEIIGTVTSIN